jgi:hypothetical protein
VNEAPTGSGFPSKLLLHGHRDPRFLLVIDGEILQPDELLKDD